QELWKTDGATTVQVKDIFKGIAGSNPAFITRFKNNLLFAATNGAKGTELWRSDGTEQNTNLVKDINSVTTASSNTYSYTPFNNEVYFNATTNAEGSEPWKSDGTAAGTVRIKDINPGSFNGADFHFSSFVPVNNNLLFIATEREHGTELWKTNGTEAGTQLLKDITTGTGGSYFNLDPGSVTEFHVLGNKALVSVSNNPYGGDNNLWVTDGTETGTSSISYISPSSYIRDFTAARGKMFFNGFSYSGTNTLWVTDGTSAGTRLINGINPRSASFSRTWDSLLLFNTAEGNLYVSDGTDAGTRMLKANLATASYDYDFFDSRSVPVNGYTVFAANDGITGAELWRTNSKTNGTLLIKDINPAGSSDPKNFTLVNNTLFFTAYDDTHGTELWKSDGTQNGTVLVKDITPGPGYQYISNLTNANGVLYFGVADSIGYLHMWQSDGTLAGTFPVQDDNLSSLHVGGFFPWMVTNNKIFFNASSYLMGGEPACGILPAANAASLFFAGKLQASDALLNWNSFNEKAVTAYNLQRSLDGINFTTIAKLNAAKKAGTNKYEFKDKDIASLNTAKVYYRLQPLQTSGEVAQNNIVVVNINSNISIDVQPNPVTNSFRLIVRSNSLQNMQVRIIDAAGNLVLSESRELAAGSSNNPYQSANWAPGVYIVKAMLADGTTKEMKIIKQ
ncbi:MAG: ELWxxDGT repeat protein, partial [Panacibacter sp.]